VAGTDVGGAVQDDARGIPFDKEPTMNTLLHTDFARQVADDRRAAVRIERRSGTGVARRVLAALIRAGRPAPAVQPEPTAAASA
jgi:hypothetical protein